ncbi:MAG: hypothetical protein D6718_00785 [Acidobacteria bacterium]|nr:MAG: hypothetical protein D6718_00785 [Acidobacteriota bacterium]
MLRSVCPRAVAAAGALLVAASCSPGPPADPVAARLEEADRIIASVVEPVPGAPSTADEGRPGRYEPVPGIEPPVRQFVVGDEEGPARPGIVLVHTRWGLDAGMRDLARRFAERGFAVAVPDLFEGVVATSRISSEELVAGVGEERAIAILRAAVEALGAREGVDAERIGLLGISVGGIWGLRFAETHGGVAAIACDTTLLPDDPEAFPRIGVPLLLAVCDQRAAFDGAARDRIRRAAEQAGVPFEMAVIQGCGTDLFDSRAIGFNAVSEQEAFERVAAFFAARLGG